VSRKRPLHRPVPSLPEQVLEHTLLLRNSSAFCSPGARASSLAPEEADEDVGAPILPGNNTFFRAQLANHLSM